jgi:hypothetical protein
MKKEIALRIKESSDKDIEYFLQGQKISKSSRILLRDMLIIEEKLNMYQFIESSNYLNAAIHAMTNTLRILTPASAERGKNGK